MFSGHSNTVLNEEVSGGANPYFYLGLYILTQQSNILLPLAIQ